jgi:hypothetical protein
MYSDLPIAVEIDVSPDRIREDLLGQLYWNVFGLQGDIAVRDGDTLIPLANHAISSESIADPPVSKITVRIQVCEEKHSMDETDEEEYRYQPPTPILIEKQGGTPILLNKFIDHVHPFLNANKDEVFKCVDEIYTQPTELGDGTKFDGVDPAEFEGVDQDEDEPTAPSLFTRSGNIPAGSRFFFDKASFNELDKDEFEVYIDLFVEGNMGMSFDQFWGYRARA